MNSQKASLINHRGIDQTSRPETNAFGKMLRNELGKHSWAKLEPAIAERFTVCENHDNSIRFTGTMHWVYCSPMGAIIAKLIKRFSILPDMCARNAAFFFNINMYKGSIAKQRGYNLGERRHFTFTSTFGDQPCLHEEFKGGLGMYLRLAVKRGALLFRDNGYYLRVKNWRIPLPRWLSVGEFELLHRNIDDQHFQIIIRVAHPLLGTLFYQRGEFERIR